PGSTLKVLGGGPGISQVLKFKEFRIGYASKESDRKATLDVQQGAVTDIDLFSIDGTGKANSVEFVAGLCTVDNLVIDNKGQNTGPRVKFRSTAITIKNELDVRATNRNEYGQLIITDQAKVAVNVLKVWARGQFGILGLAAPGAPNQIGV